MSYGREDAAMVAEIGALEVGPGYQEKVFGKLEEDVKALKGNPYEAVALILDVLPTLIDNVGGPVELDVDRIQDIVFDISNNIAPAIVRKMMKLVETFFMEGDVRKTGEISILLIITLSSCSSLGPDKLHVFRRFMTRSREMDYNLLSFMVAETVNAMMDEELPPEEIYAFASPYRDLDEVREEFSVRNWPLDIEDAKKLPGGLRSLSWYIQIY